MNEPRGPSVSVPSLASSSVWTGPAQPRGDFLLPVAKFWEDMQTPKKKKKRKKAPWFHLEERGKQLDLGPGGGAGIGCGAGVGVGLIGGAGVGAWPWNHLRVVFGVGFGCGIGIGYGFGHGIGVLWDRQPPKSTDDKHVIIEI